MRPVVFMCMLCSVLLNACIYRPLLLPPNLAMWEHDCRTLYQEELLRQPRPDELDACERFLLDAVANHDPDPVQEGFRQKLRALPEWAALHRPHTGEVGMLRVVGGDFYDDRGIWTARGVTAFLLFDRFQRGEDITPQLQWYVEHQRNWLRVFVGGVGWTQPWCPICTAATQSPDLSRLPAFFDLVALYGLRIEATVVTGDFHSFDEWRTQLQLVYNAANGRWNVTVEVVNEPGNGWAINNGLDPQALMRGIDTHGILSTYGYDKPEVAPGTEDYIAGPALDYVTVHLPRDHHFAHNAKDTQGIRTAYGKPVIDDEPLGYANFDRAGGGARTTDGTLMSAHMGTCAVFANGCTWHVDSGLYGGVPAPGSIEETISQRLQLVAAFYPSHTYTGVYTRFGLGDYPLGWSTGSDTNHAYGKILGHVQWVVVPLPKSRWAPEPVNGWTVGTFGPEVGMLTLVK